MQRRIGRYRFTVTRSTELDLGFPVFIATLVWCWAGSLTWWALLLVGLAGVEFKFKAR